jgi:hypothetical protein
LGCQRRGGYRNECTADEESGHGID